MAAGAFTLVEQGRLSWLKGDIVLDTDTMVGILIDNTKTPAVATDTTYGDISGDLCGSGDYAPETLTTVALTQSAGTVKVDADVVDFGPTVTIAARYMYVIQQAGGGPVAGDLVLGYMDLNDGGGANVESTAADFKVDFHATLGLIQAT